MEKGIIESVVASLPQSELGEVQQDGEIWEETDGGAHFKVTRHILPATDGQELLTVSISGEIAERARIVDEFTEVFGVPASQDINPNQADYIDVIAWLK